MLQRRIVSVSNFVGGVRGAQFNLRARRSMSTDRSALANDTDAAGAAAPLRTSRTGLYIRARTLRALEAASATGGASGRREGGGGGDDGSSSPRPPPSRLDTALQSLSVSVPLQPEASSPSSSSHDSILTSSSSNSTASSGTRRLLRDHIRHKSASLITLATGGNSSGEDSGSTANGTRKRASQLIPRRQMSYIPSYSSKGVNNDEYRKHNLFPLPPPGHVRPILLPSHAVLHPAAADGDKDLRIRIEGFVEQWPASVGTGQRVFMQLARQLTNLPRLPRQQPAAVGRATPVSGSQTPVTLSSFSAPTTPLHADTDDAVFFPEIPFGVPKHSPQPKEGEETLFDGEHHERPGDALTRHALALGAPERTIGRVLQAVGALPVEGKVDGSGWGEALQESMHAAQKDVQEAAAEGSTSSTTAQPHLLSATPAGPLGGSPFWANRTKDDVERLWRTLEHRLRCFWTYRKPFQKVAIEIIPVLEDEEELSRMTNRGLRWTTDEYGVATDDMAGGAPPVALLAVTDVTSDANGLFTTTLDMSADKMRHYFAAYHKKDGRQVTDLTALRMRARMVTDAGEVVLTPWQAVNLVVDEAQSVHVICDIDDTSKHTHVLGGARAVARNVFARPFEEVTIPGVQAWFARLSAGPHQENEDANDVATNDMPPRTESPTNIDDEEVAATPSLPMISAWHYVTNAPAEMHAITKAYLSTAALPAGALLLKHYFTGKGSSSFAWLQAYMQPAAARKKQNLLRCLDDFAASQFVLVGDSGEMDLDVYCDLARLRPQQVRAIWIRDVGNVSPLAKALVQLRLEGDDEGAAQATATAAATPSGIKNRVKRMTRDFATPATPPSGEQATPLEQAGGGDAAAASTVAEEFLVRLQACLNTLPSTTTIRFWQSGYDAIDDSVRQIQRFRSERGEQRQSVS